MKNAMDAEQSSERVLEITPFIPLILRGKLLEKLNYCNYFASLAVDDHRGVVVRTPSKEFCEPLGC